MKYRETALSSLLFILYEKWTPKYDLTLYATLRWRRKLEITGDTDAWALKGELEVLISWAKKWLIIMSVATCIYVNTRDTKVSRWSIEEESGPVFRPQNDLGVTVSHHLKTMDHCHTAVGEKFGIIWAWRRTITKLDTNTFQYNVHKLGN